MATERQLAYFSSSANPGSRRRDRTPLYVTGPPRPRTPRPAPRPAGPSVRRGPTVVGAVFLLPHAYIDVRTDIFEPFDAFDHGTNVKPVHARRIRRAKLHSKPCLLAGADPRRRLLRGTIRSDPRRGGEHARCVLRTPRTKTQGSRLAQVPSGLSRVREGDHPFGGLAASGRW